jgi:hypothetical protein
MLITQLERAESVVQDLFLEATDDGIEALEAVLAACREEVLRRGPRVHEGSGGDGGAPGEGGQSGEGACDCELHAVLQFEYGRCC